MKPITLWRRLVCWFRGHVPALWGRMVLGSLADRFYRCDRCGRRVYLRDSGEWTT